jgi:hypothetical protein
MKAVRGIFMVTLFCLPGNIFAWLSSSQPSRSAQIRLPETVLFASNEDAGKLREEAERLRQEISSFEKQKDIVQQEEKSKQEAETRAKQDLREQYSAIVPILKPDGSTANEKCEFRPKFAENSFITACEAYLPLGIILGESDLFAGTVTVDEVADGSNGELAGVRVGDLVRAATACRMEMVAPTWQIIAGGIGIPKTKRFMYSVDNRPFEEVMDALGSNRLDPESRPVFLVIERQELS